MLLSAVGCFHDANYSQSKAVINTLINPELGHHWQNQRRLTDGDLLSTLMPLLLDYFIINQTITELVIM